MRKHNRILLYVILLLVITSIPIEATDNSKTILIILDELDFDRIENIVENYYGLGLLNIKGRSPSSKEGLYMSISSGRKIRVDKDRYNKLELENVGLQIKNYTSFYDDLLKKNDNIKLNLLGDKLKTSFLGDDSVSLIAANKEGNIDFGTPYIEYDEKWLNTKASEALDRTDLLVMSYKIEEQKNREEILKKFINNFRSEKIIIVPRKVSSNISLLLNKNLTPILYLKEGENGILNSISTRREGFITIEDINHEILSNHGVEGENIGNNIEILKNKDPMNRGTYIYRLTFNLLLIAIVFQALIYINQAITSYSVLRDRGFNNAKLLNKFVFVNMIVSLIMGVFAIHKYWILYMIINMGLSYYITKKLKDERDLLGILSTIIYFIMVAAILLKPDIIYNSYFGFNNLFYGARYYGFNNGAMGILIATSILSYFYMTKKTDNKYINYLLIFLYFGLNMVILSAGNGANTGGFITSIVLFLAIMYLTILEDKSNIKKIGALLILGVIIFAINMYFDSKSLEQSHAISFLMRIKESGFSELINMVKIKLKELIKYTIMPPFSIVMLGQVLTLRKLNNSINGETKRLSKILFFISIVAFLINDTGMIAFIFINQFTIANIINHIEVDGLKDKASDL